MITPEQQLFARQIEARLRGATALAIAAANGGRNTNGQPLPDLPKRLAQMPDELMRLAEWARTNRPPLAQ